MKPDHVPGFLMTHSALAFVFGLFCAWVIDLGKSVGNIKAVLGAWERRRR